MYITDDDRSAAQQLAEEINRAAESGKDVTVYLASGKTLHGVSQAKVGSFVATLSHASGTSWRFRLDHIVGCTAN